MTLRMVFTAAAAAVTLDGAVQAQNRMEVLGRTPEASQFVNALNRTGQTAPLRSSGPFAVLAPTNEAVGQTPQNIRNDVFGQQPTDSMDPYLGPAVVNTHIIDGKTGSSDVQGQSSAASTRGTATS